MDEAAEKLNMFPRVPAGGPASRLVRLNYGELTRPTTVSLEEREVPRDPRLTNLKPLKIVQITFRGPKGGFREMQYATLQEALELSDKLRELVMEIERRG